MFTVVRVVVLWVAQQPFHASERRLRNTMVRAVSSLRFQWDTHTSTSLYRIGAGIAALSMRSPEDVSLQKTSELLSDAQTQPFFMHEAEEPAPVSGRISAEVGTALPSAACIPAVRCLC